MENKRKKFPRFYFLTNDELLSILAKAKNAVMIKNDISKCFESINLLDFVEDYSKTIVAMNSLEPEQLPEKV